MSKELYKAALQAMNRRVEDGPNFQIGGEDFSNELLETIQEVAESGTDEDSLKISFTFEGKDYTFSLSDFSGHRHYDMYFYYLQFDDDHDFAIVSEGYYSSWDGSGDFSELEVRTKKVVEDFVFV